MPLLMRKATFRKRELKNPISKYSIYGVLISIVSVFAATSVTSLLFFDEISIATVIKTQKTNPILWLLDLSPVVFAVWGPNYRAKNGL